MSRLRDVKRPMLRGRCIAWVPNAAGDFASFLDWWKRLGRRHTSDPQGWTLISGPGVVRNRAELIPDEAWNALPAAERKLIEAWLEQLDFGVLFD